MIYRCLVADDNLIDRDLILKHLSKISTIQVVATCCDGHEAAEVLAKEHIDIVFSDIDMPDLCGMGLKKSLKTPPVFVFITSHAEYAVESFHLDVVDFIVKPVGFERFFKTVNKVVEYLELKKVASCIASKQNIEVQYDIPNEKSSDYFFIKENHGITRLSFSDVLYIESLGDYSKLYTAIEKHITLISLKQLEKQLPQSLFMRVHKQFIVNLDHVVTITATEALLTNKQTVPLSAVTRQLLIDIVVDSKILSRTT